MKTKRTLRRAAGFLFLATSLCAAEPALVRRLAPGQVSPPATLAEMAWLIGRWGGALDDHAQESMVLAPNGRQQPGFARAWRADGTTIFYEINALMEVDGSLEFRVKHFGGDLVGWEPRDDYARHRLVAVEDGTWFFDGITFVNRGPDVHDVHVLLTTGDRAGEVVTVHQRRTASLDSTDAKPEDRIGAALIGGTVQTVAFESTVLRDTLTGVNPHRSFRIYLPPSYATDPTRHYPVVYFCHSINWSPAQMFADGNMKHLLETGFAAGVVGEFILVAADYTSPTMGSLYEESPVSGRWLTYTVEEVVPFVDRTYRTLPQRSSRAVVGDFMGGRGALVLAMQHPETFGCVYALHPVATGNGDLPWGSQAIDWDAILQAPNFDALPATGLERIFVMISQAFLPHPGRRPFHSDFLVESAEGGVRANPDRVRRAQRAMVLGEGLDACAENLRSLRGIALDWGRFDPNQAHVTSNREFSRKLADLGIAHEAEEYAGGPWDRTWTEDGRFARRLLPFLGRHLVAKMAP